MWGTPPEPGTAELEPGEFLAYHYTSSDEALSSILREGVKLDTSERRPTEEAAAVWGSFERPQGFKRYVEFKVRREDMWVGQPSSDEDMARAAQMGHNFTMVKNEIPVDRITTWSSPEIEDVRVWQRELADATPEWKKSVLNGAYDGVPAVDKAKQVLAKEFGSPGWAEKPSGVTDGAAIKRVSVPRVDTDRLQRRADRLRREIDDPDFVYPGARMGFRHRAAELTKIESELVKRGALEPEARRTSVVAALVPLVVELAGCQSRECAPPPVGVGGSSGSGAAAVIVPNPVVELNGLPDEVAQAVEAARRKLGALDVHESEEATALIKEAYDRAGGSLEYYAFDQGLDRASLVKAVLGIERVGFNPGGDPNWLEPTVELMAKRTRATLLGAGFSLDDRIALYRGVYDSEIDPFRMDPDGLDPEENQGGTSGITSWTTSPKLAGMYGTSLIVAAVPVRQILSWDQVGVQISRFGIGNEVLVAPESMVTNVLEGVFPAGKRIYPSQVASGVFELACRDASCAPPPVGTGGSKPGAEGLVADKLRTQVVETIEDVQAGSEEGLKFARQMMASREKTMGFHDLNPHNQALDPGFEAEWKALAKVVPVEEGFVRRGTPEAEALISEVRNVLPAAQVGQFQDVHAESVRALLQGVALYPAEVRAKIEGVALGYTEAEQHVAAFGPHGGGLNGPYASQWTLWLGPKAVRPAVGEARPEGTAASVIATVSGTNRQRLVAAHEMGHVVHSMAGEIAWKESGFYVDTRTDPQVPDVPTTPYGETSKGERVAETFALAARDTFAGLEPSQQDLIVSVLDRAGLRPSDLAFAAATDEPYEVQFWGDSFELDEAAAELQASGCQSADCAPPPVGTGGSKGGESWPMREEDRESAAGVKVGLAYQRWIKEGDNIRLVRKAYALNERIYELATARSEYTPSLSQAEAYDQAVKDLDAHPAMYDDWYITTSWWASMRRVVSATSKSEHPDPDMTKLLSEMHRMTVEALGGPGSTIELGRSFDSGAADVGNSPDKFDWSRSSSDSASSGITSWTNNNNEYDSWGEESVVKTFPVEQVLMREGSIDGEFLVGESVERVQEIVGR